MATFIGGACMTLVQIVAGKMEGEYLLFLAMLDMMGQMAIPTLGVQTVLAQETARSQNEAGHRLVASAARWLLWAVLVLWLLAALGFFVFRQRFLGAFEITNPAALVFMLLAALVGMATPVMAGLLQGKQDFKWFGFATLFNGVGRLAGVAIAVVWIGALAAGAMSAVLVGSALTLSIMTWHTRELWMAPGSTEFSWMPLLKRILPISLILGVPTVLFTVDSIIVKNFFGAADDYGRARMIGRTLVFITAPMVFVMFPRVVRSAAKGEATSVLAQTLAFTGIVGGIGATFLTFMPDLPIRVLWPGEPKFLSAAQFVPWFAWCMLPLALANVLISNLLARERYSALPWLSAVAIGYILSLRYKHESLLSVIQTLGVFGLLLVLVCVVFTIRQPRAGVTRH